MAKERPKTDDSLCFICQEQPPKYLAVRCGEEFKLCPHCRHLVESENIRRNRIKSALHQADRFRIFQYTLGLDPVPQYISFKKLQEAE